MSVGAEGEQVRGSTCGLRPRDGSARLLGRAEPGGRGAEVGGGLSRTCSAEVVPGWVTSGDPLGWSAPALAPPTSSGGLTRALAQ